MNTSESPHTRATVLSEAVALVAGLVARGGPRESDYAALDRLMHWLPALTPDEVETLRGALGEAVENLDTMQAFAYQKPRGYAGDFQIIDRIYCEHVTTNESLAAWDRYFHAQPAVRAVRNRKRYFHTLLDRYAARGTPLRVLNLASGPGRCMAEWLRAHPDTPVNFTCIELDPNAIKHAKKLVAGHESRTVFQQANVLRYTPVGEFDVIWAAGICDYFSDDVVVRLVRRLLPALARGGELVIGNFCVTNPSRPYMEILGDWRLEHRSAETLRQIAHAAGAPPAAVSIGAEPEAVNLFLHVAAA